MDTLAVVLEAPERLILSRLDLAPRGDADVVVEIEWSGISTGTERLLWSGRMPTFPGMGLASVARRLIKARVANRISSATLGLGVSMTDLVAPGVYQSLNRSMHLLKKGEMLPLKRRAGFMSL
jgi:hypothetical protein